MRPALISLLASAVMAATTQAQAATAPASAWVQQTGEGTEVRAVTPGGECPSVVVDGRSEPMTLRAAPDADFPGVCQLKLSAHVRRAELDGLALALPVAEPRRIVVFADTGCRLKGKLAQSCNDPDAWPFAEVARRAAARKPDLTIHIGDYYYRETPCPEGDKGCVGSPYGDKWDAWRSDLFAPAEPLLRASPWVFVRGNHESCSRGGPGWFRFLDAAPQMKACPGGAADPFTVDIGGLNLYVLDSADTEDRSAPPKATADFAHQLDVVGPMLASKPGWLVTHRPIWGLVPVVRVGPLGAVNVALNVTEQTAVRGRDLKAVPMILSGHIHHFASFDFGPSRPAQLIVGTGGDVGEPADSPKLETGTQHVDGLDAAWTGFDRFGYMVLDRQIDPKATRPNPDDDWVGVFYDYKDRPVVHCRLHARALTCAAA